MVDPRRFRKELARQQRQEKQQREEWLMQEHKQEEAQGAPKLSRHQIWILSTQT
jgi:hypothetical protein